MKHLTNGFTATQWGRSIILYSNKPPNSPGKSPLSPLRTEGQPQACSALLISCHPPAKRMLESAALTPVLNPAFLHCKPGVTKADEDKSSHTGVAGGCPVHGEQPGPCRAVRSCYEPLCSSPSCLGNCLPAWVRSLQVFTHMEVFIGARTCPADCPTKHLPPFQVVFSREIGTLNFSSLLFPSYSCYSFESFVQI